MVLSHGVIPHLMYEHTRVSYTLHPFPSCISFLGEAIFQLEVSSWQMTFVKYCGQRNLFWNLLVFI